MGSKPSFVWLEECILTGRITSLGTAPRQLMDSRRGSYTYPNKIPITQVTVYNEAASGDGKQIYVGGKDQHYLLDYQTAHTIPIDDLRKVWIRATGTGSPTLSWIAVGEMAACDIYTTSSSTSSSTSSTSTSSSTTTSTSSSTTSSSSTAAS